MPAAESQESRSRKTVSRRVVVRIAVSELLCLHAGLLAWMAYRYSPMIDEPAHLVAGISHWKFGRFDLYRVNPPLVRLVALTLWCLCPNILGNGALITPDVAAASFGVAAGYSFWRWLRPPVVPPSGGLPEDQAVTLPAASHEALIEPRPSGSGFPLPGGRGSTREGLADGRAEHILTRRAAHRRGGWTRALVAGVVLGLAELAKSTWIILFALWPLLWVGAQIANRRSQIRNPKRKIRNPTFVQLAFILLIALYLVNLGYGFENSFKRLDSFRFVSQTLGGADAHTAPGNRFAGTWLGAIPIPMPANYVVGIDVQRYDFEEGNGRTCAASKKWAAGGTITSTRWL